MSEKDSIKYRHSEIVANQANTVKRLQSFFPKDKKSNLFDYDLQKSFSDNRKHIDPSVDEFVQLLYQVHSNVIENCNIKPSQCDKYSEIRASASKYYFEILMFMRRAINPKYDFSQQGFLNIGYAGYMAGISPEAIENPEDRKEYEKFLWNNSKLSWERRIQSALVEIEQRIKKDLNQYLIVSYAHPPRAAEELAELLEKYQYPEEEKIKIFKALNIAYKGFREWKTTDGLFSPTAKLIALDKGDVKLEKADGKRITIEFSALRKEDQNYVKEQLKVQPATPVAMRTWTSRNGKHNTQAKYVSADKNQVTLENAEGEVFPVDISKLSTNDQNYVKEQLEAKPELPNREK
ncbi:MAG: hypothetical protein LBT46_13455 [Planctomycetaceae bacterium]|nr:hypothetical protein [Planctomycetaceae bacterium]